MSRRGLGVLVLTALACATVAQAQVSQTSGAIRGAVTNQRHEPVPGAVVTVRNLETGFTQTGVAGAKGDYALPLLPTGLYEITFTARGMKTLKDLKVRVNLGAATTVNPVMDSAEASAIVEVVGASSTVDATQTITMASVDQKLVEEIPLVTRNFTDMARLTPGVAAGAGANGNPRLIVEGGRQIFNAVQIDGASNNSAFFNEQRGGVYTPFIFGADTIKELQVVTNGFDVQYGQAGATINAITKGGTNDFSGSALWEIRRSLWTEPIPPAPSNASNFNVPANLKRTNDSYNLNFNAGGALVKDKLWYFVGVERFHKLITSTPSATSVLTEDPATPLATSLNNGYVAWEAMLGSRLGQVVTSTSGLTLADEYGDTYSKTSPHSAHSYPMENTNTVYFGRLDYSMSANHRFVLRCNFQDMTDTLQNTSANPNNAESNNIPTRVQSISWVLESNNIWSSSLFTESRVQFAREARPMRGNAVVGTPSITIPSDSTSMAFGTKTSTPRESNENTMQVFTMTTYTSGDWQAKLGLEYTKVDVDNQFFQNNSGAWNFGTYKAAALWATSGFTAANAAGVGTVQYNAAISPYSGRIPMWTKYGSVFAQVQNTTLLDHRLTLTAGVRSFSQSFSDNPHPNPNLAGLDQGMGGHTVDPRLAFSYDMTGKGTTVLRGGFGQFTSPTPLLLHSNTMTGNGMIITNYSFKMNATNYATFNGNGGLGVDNFISGTSMQKLSDPAVVALAGNATISASPTSLWDPNNKLSQSRKFNLGLEHDFGKGLVVGMTATYVKYLNLQRFENINLGQKVGTTISSAPYDDGYLYPNNSYSTAAADRPNTAVVGGRHVDFRRASITPGNPVGGFGDVYLVKTDGWGHYRGLSGSIRKTWSEDTGIIFNVTWSSAKDTGSFERGTYTSAGNYSSELGSSLTPDPQSPASNYGYGDSDRRWVANMVAFFPGPLGTEWSFRGVYQTGLPYTAYTSADTNTDGMINNIATGHVRNDQRQPNFGQIDMRLSRTWKVVGTFRIQAILDVYNVLDKADYAVATGNYVVESTNFGKLTTADKTKSRELQLGIKAIW